MTHSNSIVNHFCNFYDDFSSKLSNDKNCNTCYKQSLINKRKKNIQKGIVLPFYIISYGIARLFGGPEEGGWWFDWVSINEVRQAFTFQQGIRHAHELKETYPQPRFDRFSCANNGETDNYIVLCYSEDDPNWPKETKSKPHYE